MREKEKKKKGKNLYHWEEKMVMLGKKNNKQEENGIYFPKVLESYFKLDV